MKQIYEIPEVTVYEVGPAKQMLSASDFGVNNVQSTSQEEFTNSNYMDDQATPWYK